MLSPLHTYRSALAVIALVCAMMSVPTAAPAAPSETERLRAVEEYYGSFEPLQDVRSPDTRDAAIAANAGQDLRSPDARDTELREIPQGAAPSVVHAPDATAVDQPVAQVPAAEFDWTDALVGAAVGLILLMSAGVLLARRRMHRDQSAIAA